MRLQERKSEEPVRKTKSFPESSKTRGGKGSNRALVGGGGGGGKLGDKFGARWSMTTDKCATYAGIKVQGKFPGGRGWSGGAPLT